MKMTTLVEQLGESRTREATKDKEMKALSQEVMEVKGRLQRAEADLELKRRGLEQAKSRERKLTNEVHEVRFIKYDNNIYNKYRIYYDFIFI